MPVYRIREEDDGEGGVNEIYELAGNGSWEASDARATTRWFKGVVADLNKAKEGRGDQMRRVVRLTKGFARSRVDWKELTTSGIVITKLVVDHFVPSEGRDDEALLETWKAIRDQLKKSTQVAHPVNTSNLAEEGNAMVSFFKEKLDWALGELAVLEKGCTRSEARQAWDSVFDTDYFENLPEPKEEDKRAFFIPASQKSDVRHDGNGRFG